MNVSWTVGPVTYRRYAWTGGDTPRSNPLPKAKRKAFVAIRRDLFREQVAECLGLDFWACSGTSALERARIFWNRATLDAFRTVRDGGGK